MKREEFISHSIRIENLLLKEKSVLDTREIISSVSGSALEEHEIDQHIEEVYSLQKLSNLLRAQMLVSICGYFEFSVKELAKLACCKTIRTDSDLSGIITSLSRTGLGVINSNTKNTLNEYRYLRNACTHQNQSSQKRDRKLADAEKYLPGVIISHHSEKGSGKGKIELDSTFLTTAINVHFDVLNSLHDYYTKA